MGQIGDVHIKQFGMGKGQVGIQLTSDKGQGYVQLNKEDAAKLAARLARWAGSSELAQPGEYESVSEADIELSPGISIKTDNPGMYKGTKTTSGVVGGKSGEAMELANRVLDAIEEQDPSSSEEALALAKKFCEEMNCDSLAKKLVYKQLAKMGYVDK